MKTVSGLQLGALPSSYGKEPPEGRKYINAYIDWSIDQDWVFDFTVMQEQKRFTYVQQMLINALNTAANKIVFYVNGILYGNVASGAAPIIFPILPKEPTIIEFFGNQGGTATGSLQLQFMNFASFNLVA